MYIPPLFSASHQADQPPGSRPIDPHHLLDRPPISVIHNLHREAGLQRSLNGRRYDLRVHSIRKFFRTQLAALGVNRDYIDYMMVHKVSTYHDVKMKAIEFLTKKALAEPHQV